MGRRRRRSGRTILLLLVLVAAAAGAYVYTERVEPAGARPVPVAPGSLRVHYVDVGQGDGTIWELPDGRTVVYDCGPPSSSADASPMVRYLRDVVGLRPGDPIGTLIASHGHLDHVGGCDEIFETYEVATVIEAWYEGADAPASYRRFLDAVRAEGSEVRTLADLPLGVRVEANATLLWPPAFAPGGWDAIAEASLVVRLEHGTTSFCFQGDIEDRQEAQLDATCDVYLVGHHGSRSASSAAWLDRMSPRIAVVSFGENSYGHPHPEALCRIQDAGAEVYATHRTQGVVLTSDGTDVRVERGAPETTNYCTGASYWR